MRPRPNQPTQAGSSREGKKEQRKFDTRTHTKIHGEGRVRAPSPRRGTLSGEKCLGKLPGSLSVTLFAFHLEMEENGKKEG